MALMRTKEMLEITFEKIQRFPMNITEQNVTQNGGEGRVQERRYMDNGEIKWYTLRPTLYETVVLYSAMQHLKS